MSTVDWPTGYGAAFAVARYTLGSSTSKSGFEGFYSGERESLSHLSDRFLVNLDMPPCMRADAALRSAFLMSLDSAGDYVRFGMWKQPAPRGTLRGNLTVAANGLAGARTVTLTGARAAPNLLSNSGFEIDSNADGLADGWATFTPGTTGTVTHSLQPGPMYSGCSGKFQLLQAAALNGGLGLQRGVAVSPNVFYSLSVDADATAGTTVRLQVDWLTAGSAYISSSTADSGAAPMRRSLSAVAPATAALAVLYIFVMSGSGGAVDLYLDQAQWEPSAMPTPYAGFAKLIGGDFIATGGNLLQCYLSGATADDAGRIVVPLTLPLQRPVTAGAAVTWDRPVGSWELVTDGIDIDYGPAEVQQGVSLSFRQKVV